MFKIRYIVAFMVLVASIKLGAQRLPVYPSYASRSTNWRAKCVALKQCADKGVVLDSGLIYVEYFDGLGRNVQTQSFGSGNSGFSASCVVSQTLDAKGRPVESLLPVAVTGKAGQILTRDELCEMMQEPQACFTTTIYETDHFGRPSEVSRPGVNRKRMGKTQQYEYTCNQSATTSDYYCPRMIIHDNKIQIHQPWKEGDLSVTTITDEDGEKTYTFTDPRGLIWLKRTVSSTGRREDTLFLYDYAGRLLYILPPCMSAKILKGNIVDLSTSDADRIYSYKYDSRERPVEVRMPSAGMVKIAYTPLSQTALWQDASLAADSKVLRTTYDELGRKAYVSCHTAPQDAFSTLHVKSYVHYIGQGFAAHYGYTLPDGIDKPGVEQILSVDYYDDYSFLNIFPEYADSLAYKTINGYGKTAPSAKKRHTGSARRIFNKSTISDEWLVAAYYYDEKGRVIQSVSTNIAGGYDRQAFVRSFDGRVEKSLHSHCTPDTLLIREREYTYNAMAQLSSVSMRTNGCEKLTLTGSVQDPRGWVLSQTLLNGKIPISYDYTDAGELISITSAPFSQTFYRDEPLNFGYVAERTPLYDGRISGEYFSLNSRDLINTTANYDNRSFEGTYAYSYEGVRLLSADYRELSRKITEPGVMQIQNYKFSNPNYSVHITYNADGLPARIMRYGLSDIVNGVSGSTGFNMQGIKTTEYQYSKVDDLTLKYIDGKLNRVDDASENDCTLSIGTDFNEAVQRDDEYEYDVCGRLTRDRNKGISISYNILGLPAIIKGLNDRIYYTYSSDGELLKTEYFTISWEEVTTGTGISYMREVFNLSGTRLRCGEVEYADGVIDRVWNEAGWMDSHGQYVAAIRDAHGSLRATYTQPKPQSGGLGSIGGGIVSLQPVHQPKSYSNLTAYYPGGLPFADWQGDDRYLFSGKELERNKGLLTYDFHARTYDPQLGLFNRPDPCADSYPSQPTYLYCAGNPISLTDPTGMEFDDVLSKIIPILKNAINERKEKVKEKDKNDYKQLCLFEEHINILEMSDQVYGYSPEKSINKDVFGMTKYDETSGKIMIYDCTFNGKLSMMRIAHEVEHMWQFESGQISFGAKLDKMIPTADPNFKQFTHGLLDINDEYDAYQVQGLFGNAPSRYAISRMENYKNYPLNSFSVSDIINRLYDDGDVSIELQLQGISNTMQMVFRYNNHTYKPTR